MTLCLMGFVCADDVSVVQQSKSQHRTAQVSKAAQFHHDINANKLKRAINTPNIKAQQITPDSSYKAASSVFAVASLAKALRKAYQNSLDVQQALVAVRIAEQSLEKARSAYYPILQASATHTANKTRNRQGDFANHRNNLEGRYDLEASYNIYQGGASDAAISQAQYNLQRARSDFDSTLQRVRTNVASAFFAVCLRLQAVETAAAYAYRTSQEQKEARVRFELGDIDKANLEVAESGALKAELDMHSNVLELKNAIINLESFCQSPIDILSLEQPIFEDYIDKIQSSQQLCAVAARRNPKLQSLLQAIDAAVQEKEITSARLKPSVDAKASVNQSLQQNKIGGVNQTQRGSAGSGQLAVTVTMPLFNVGVHNAVAESTGRLMQAQQAHRKEQRSIIASIETTRRTLDITHQRFVLAQSYAKKAKIIYMASKEKVREGTLPYIEILRADKDWVAAKMQVNELLIQWATLHVQLLELTGEKLPDDPTVDTYVLPTNNVSTIEDFVAVDQKISQYLERYRASIQEQYMREKKEILERINL